MAGIKLLEKNSVTLNYVVNELLKPDLRQVIFDDACGGMEIGALLYDPFTVVYGIMEGGKPEPIGVVYFSGVMPYRTATVSAAIFNSAKRDKGIITAQVEKIKADMIRRYATHSIKAAVTGDNEGSKKLLERIGFKKVGVMPEAIMADGKYQDLTLYYLLLGNGARED